MRRSIKNKKVLLFDLFFTLISTFDNKDHIVHECEVLDIDRQLWDRVSVSQYHDRGLGLVNDPLTIVKNVVDEIRDDVGIDLLQKATETRIKRFRRAVVDVPQKNVQVLKQLVNQGYRLGLVSNADVIDIFGWQESPLCGIFEHTIFSCEVGLAKPDRKIYEHALSLFNASAHECTFIGDGGSDELMGAKRVGISTILTKEYRSHLWPESVVDIERYADDAIMDLSNLMD